MHLYEEAEARASDPTGEKLLQTRRDDEMM